MPLITFTKLSAELESLRNPGNPDRADRADRAGRARSARVARGELRRIVFTNGVFDLLHLGHVEYLSKAKSFGDILIVGVNRDSSVRRLKGRGRPLQAERDRARIVGALKPVDFVVLFGEDTPEKLIELIKPDVLVKGADYEIGEIAGARFVKSYGGSVRRVRLLAGRSTSDMIRKLSSISH